MGHSTANARLSAKWAPRTAQKIPATTRMAESTPAAAKPAVRGTAGR